jgi:hypothetical protein
LESIRIELPESFLFNYRVRSLPVGFTFIGRKDTASEYSIRTQALGDAVNTRCFADGFYLCGPSTKEYSRHIQVFAVLSEPVTGTEARDLMVRTMYDSSLVQFSRPLQFYVFQAMEKVGIYTKMFPALLDPWRRMLADDLTTWAESLRRILGVAVMGGVLV